MWDRSATGQPPAIHLGRAPRRAVPAGWPLQMHNLRPITAEERTAALLAAWDDPRLIGDSGTQVASQPPLVFQEVVAWRRPLERFQHRPAACLVWASPDSPDAAVSIPRSAASGPLTHLAGSAEALPDGGRWSDVSFWTSLMRSVFGWRRSRSASNGATEPRHEGAQSWPSAPREDDAPPPTGARAAEAGETGPATARNDRRSIGVASPAHLIGRPPQSLVMGRPLATSGARHLPPAPDVPISRPAKAASAADRHRSSVRPDDGCSTGESTAVHTEHPSGDALEAPSNGALARAAKGDTAMSHVSSDQDPPTTTGRPPVVSAAAHRSEPPRRPRRIAQASPPHPVTWHPSGEAVSPAAGARAAPRPTLLPAAPHRPGPPPGTTPSAPSRDEASKPSSNTAYEAPSAPPALRQGVCEASQSVTGAAAAAVFRTSPETGSGRGRLKAGQQAAERRQVVEPPAAPPQQTAPKPPFRVSTPLGARAAGVTPREATGPAQNRGPRSVAGMPPGAIAGSRVGQAQAVQAAQQEMAQLFPTRGSDRARTGHTLADMVMSARRPPFPRAPAGSLTGPPPGSSTASPDRTGLVQRPRPGGATPPPPTSQGPALALAPGVCTGPQSLPTAPQGHMPGAAATVLGTGSAPGPADSVMAAARSGRGVVSPEGSRTPDGHPRRAADNSRTGPLATTPSALAPGRGRSRVMPYAHTAATPEDPRTAWTPTERPAVSVTAARPVRAHFVPAIASSGGGLALSPAQRQPGNPLVPLTARMAAGSVTVPANPRTGGSANWGVPGGRSTQERR